jgi:monovalent cation:H+ antiporter-2, CPA2 family
VSLAAAAPEAAGVFVELGLLIVVLAALARLCSRAGFSPIPFYLLVGLLVGRRGIVEVQVPDDILQFGADLGVVLLLFMLGLEYSGEELQENLRTGLPTGVVDLVLNFPPGLVLGLLLGWDAVTAILLGGVTYISSSGVVSKLLHDLDRLGNRETAAVLTTLVIEDLVMAAYLPLVAVLLLGTGLVAGAISLGVAMSAAAVALLIAIRFSQPISRAISSRSNEVVVLSVVGLVLVVAGVAEQLQVSSAVGAFLFGIALSGPVADRAEHLIGPLRDLFAAIFFLTFGMTVEVVELPPMIGLAFLLGVVTAATKVATGWHAARRLGIGTRGRVRAGTGLIARGEFSIVIAGIGVAAGVEHPLGSLAAAYVLLLAIAGPIVTRVADPVVASRLRARRSGQGS